MSMKKHMKKMKKRVMKADKTHFIKIGVLGAATAIGAAGIVHMLRKRQQCATHSKLEHLQHCFERLMEHR